LSTYIAHDDNWGSNFCIPKKYLDTKRCCPNTNQSPTFCSEDKKGIAYIIGTTPNTVKLSPIRAEVIGADYLFQIVPQMPDTSHPWRKRLEKSAYGHRLVLRPILITGIEYSNHLSKIRDWHGNKINPTLINLFKKILTESHLWLIELSIPELFSANQRKIGEVLIRADCAPNTTRDFKNFIIARVPGHFAAYESGDEQNPKFKFIPCGANDHTELFGCENEAN
jgi:hypothetical protein